MIVLSLIACLLPIAAFAEDGDETLLLYLSKSDVVVLGEFTTEPVGAVREAGLISYQAGFKIAQLIKGETRGNRKNGGVIRVNLVRQELAAEDRLPDLKKGGKCILFLKVADKRENPTHMAADVWFGVQRANSVMAKSLTRLVAEQVKKGR